MKLQNAQIRELALLFLYERQFNPDITLETAVEHMLANQVLFIQHIYKDELDEEAYERVRNYLVPAKNQDSYLPKGNLKKVKLSEDAELPEYLYTLTQGIISHEEEIDTLIDANIHGKWSVNRLETINLQILRLAVYEMLYADEEVVPRVVALSEALELAKLYSDDRSRKFINGVLSNILEELNKEA